MRFALPFENIMNMKNELFNLDQETIVITGVSGQLGSVYSKALLEHGASKVIGLDIKDSENSKKLSLEYESRFLFIETDITDKDSTSESLKKIKALNLAPTVLINNAGLDSNPDSSIDDACRFEDFSEETWDKVLDVNLKGAFLCCQIFGGDMAKNKKGTVINISSIYGLVSPDQNMYEYRRQRGEEFYKPVAYSASKSGLINLTRYLAVYWAKDNVSVNTLTIAGVFNNQDKDFLDQYNQRIPIGRMAKEDEYNGAIIFLSSNASNYMTGSNLVIDGGWTAI